MLKLPSRFKNLGFSSDLDHFKTNDEGAELKRLGK